MLLKTLLFKTRFKVFGSEYEIGKFGFFKTLFWKTKFKQDGLWNDKILLKVVTDLGITFSATEK
jgi:hypothetical protein